MISEEKYYVIGVDGGATQTRGVLFDNTGKTLATAIGGPSSLSVCKDSAPQVVSSLISSLCEQSEIPKEYIDAVGLGLAGASDKDGRDLLFRELDKLELAGRTIIANDAEAAYEVGCPSGVGILATVSTGVICIARSVDGKIYRTAGDGHEDGDIGSGYWMGKQVLMHLALNETSVYGDKELTELLEMTFDILDESEFKEMVEKVMSSETKVKDIASFAKPICQLAENGNDVALAIVQEATQGVAEYITELAREIKYTQNHIILAGNGNVITNDTYRKCLNDALQFEYNDIKWTFSKVSPAYGAGLLASRVQDIDITLPKLIEGGALATTHS
ncbi:MAG: hypothetical protein ISR90_00955 [Candidatus Marinimicrobia bacterium]|nr:hypothetical protein [Candidatus Neomarinimicrobiota bacterium]MBL7022613.1 hypothetical protein [Candidatus Neomarinimicrobiota bacterium]MBL7109644.1 hypothetical protein [Candidatus Neomarinimicrobiota bacterium]